jgi:hypothetical protein
MPAVDDIAGRDRWDPPDLSDVVALAAAPDTGTFAGRTMHVGDVARRYGFTDLDGHQPGAFHASESPLSLARRLDALAQPAAFERKV